ncbi:MAG: threonine ammonia-lyase [Steroidobacteraceae bacterium]
MNHPGPNLEAIREMAARLSPWTSRTPVHVWRGREIDALLGSGTEVTLKLELFQHSGTFKARGVMANLLALRTEQARAGITAMSAGNHAIAVAWAAHQLGLSAKVVMQASANPARVAAARAWGAEVLIAVDGPTGFALAEKIAAEEGRTFIHPFEGPLTALGTATLGLELIEQAPELDAVILGVGGGGLAGGASAVIRLLEPACRVYGVEPEGADSMHRSFAAGSPQRLESVRTIADSLGPPMALPYSFELCRRGLHELVMVSDDEIVQAMGLLFREMKLAVEPGGAASTAALIYRLRDELRGARVGVVLCGSNIDLGSFHRLLESAST